MILILFCAGGRQAADIVNWLKKKTGPPAATVEDAAAVKALTEANDVVLVGFFKDQESAGAKAFLEVADSTDDLPFAITSADAVFSEYKVEGEAVVLLKNFDEGRNDLTEGITAEAVKTFIAGNSMPTVIEFTQEVGKYFKVLTLITVLLATIYAQWEGMGDAGSAKYEPALLHPIPDHKGFKQQ